MSLRRPLLFVGLLLSLQVALAPAVLASLAVTVDQSQGYDVWASGATSLNAPQNLTITQGDRGPYIQWSPPSSLDGTQLVGYTLYRLPGPDAKGETTTFDLGPGRTGFTDHSALENNTYVYFITAQYAGTVGESIPSVPVSSMDFASPSPHCGVVSIYASPPYYDTHLSCLFSM
jgi:hypothetical protein